MTASPVYSFGNRKLRVILLSFLLLLFSVDLLYGQLTVTCTPQPVTCNAGNDGQIEVSVTGGTGLYQFSLNNTDWEPATPVVAPYTFSGLTAATYHIYVKDDNASPATGEQSDVVISQPDPLAFTLGGQDWTCPACNGSVTVTVTGGTAPYDTTVMLGAIEQPYPFTGLCAGTYTVSVVDANSCPATPQPSQDVTIALDNTPPVGCTFPPNQRYNLATQYPAAGIGAISTTFSAYTYDGNSTGLANNDSITIGIDAANYSNVQVRIGARQTGGSITWGATDLLELSYTLELNGSSTVWTPFFVDNCRWEADPLQPCNANEQTNLTTSAWLDVPPAAGNTIFIMIRVKSDAGTKDYSVEQFEVRGRSVYTALAPAYTGAPSGCTDTPAGGITYNPTDQPVHWYCHNPAEFSFVRSWTAQDQCGNTTTPANNQLISVGTPPSITQPKDTILDFCYYLGVDITAPVNSDNCGTPVVTWSITSPGFNRNGTGDIVGLDFPNPIAEIAYTINWTVTDSIGFTNSADQLVTFRAPIAITLDAIDDDFCSNDNASFTISLTGGTGTYIAPPTTFDPVVAWTNGIEDGSGAFNTTNLVYGSTETISISVTDANVTGINGSCTSSVFTFTSGGGVFFVHQKIPTNPLQRIP